MRSLWLKDNEESWKDVWKNNVAHRNISSTVANIIIALILLIFVYSLERYMDDKLSGKLGKAKVVLILFMYMFAIGFYVTILYGGVYSG